MESQNGTGAEITRGVMNAMSEVITEGTGTGGIASDKRRGPDGTTNPHRTTIIQTPVVKFPIA
jgi:hypothetical protein